MTPARTHRPPGGAGPNAATRERFCATARLSRHPNAKNPVKFTRPSRRRLMRLQPGRMLSTPCSTRPLHNSPSGASWHRLRLHTPAESPQLSTISGCGAAVSGHYAEVSQHRFSGPRHMEIPPPGGRFPKSLLRQQGFVQLFLIFLTAVELPAKVSHKRQRRANVMTSSIWTYLQRMTAQASLFMDWLERVCSSAGAPGPATHDPQYASVRVTRDVPAGSAIFERKGR